jgi:hypothetical protein
VKLRIPLLAGAVLAAIAGCAAGASHQGNMRSSRPATATASMPTLPIPLATAKRMPPGVIYLQGGPPGAPPPWISLWEIEHGRESLLTRGDAGRQIDGFAASPAGIIVSDGANVTAGLARWTSTGPVWLHPAGDKTENIAGLLPDISQQGVITYMLPPHGANGKGATTIWIRPSWTGRDKVVYQSRTANGPLTPLFGPRNLLAVSGPQWQRLSSRARDIAVLARDGSGGVIRLLRSGFAELGYTPLWSPEASALVVRSASAASEILFLSGRRDPLPAGWRPLTWDPSGRRILMVNRTELGIWSMSRPRQVSVIGPISHGFGIWHGAWLPGPAKM